MSRPNYCTVGKKKLIYIQEEEEDRDYVSALFLKSLGPKRLSIYNDKNMPEDHKISEIMKGFDEHFGYLTNETFERFIFNKRNQESDKKIEEYVTALRKLIKKSES